MTVDEVMDSDVKIEPVSYDFRLEALPQLILLMLRDGRSLIDIEQVVALDRSIVENEVIHLLQQELLEGTLSQPMLSDRAREICADYENAIDEEAGDEP